MNWERHLREMILAGGALVAAACSSNGASRGAEDVPDANESPDANEWTDANGASQVGCNVCSDPCSVSPEILGCQPGISPESPVPEGGSPHAETPDGGPVDAAPADAEAGPSDAALMDAETDATADCSATDAADAADE